MKVLFLDIDGVLNSYQSIHMYHRHNKNNPNNKNGIYEWNPYYEFCPIAINNLVLLLEAVPDLKIVISSTWRLGCDTVEELQELFDPIPDFHGGNIIKERIIDRTPCFRGDMRGNEIKEWLDHNEVEKYTIIDDDSDMHSWQPFIKTDSREGLTWNIKEAVIKHFKGQDNDTN